MVSQAKHRIPRLPNFPCSRWRPFGGRRSSPLVLPKKKTLGISPVNHTTVTGTLIGLFYEVRITQVRIGKKQPDEVAHEGADQARRQRRTR